MSTTLKWKIFAQVGRVIARPADVGTIAFTGEAGTRIYSQFALPLDRAYIPLALSPTATYHQVVRNMLENAGYPQASKKLPFTIKIPELGDAYVFVQARVYPPNTVVLTLRLNISSDLAIKADFDKLVGWRNVRSISGVNEIVKYTLGVIDSGDHRNPSDDVRFQVFPGFSLHVADNTREMLAFVRENAREVVGLLLGVHAPDAMDDDLVETIKGANIEFNRKDPGEQLLLNKQGLVFLAPYGEYRGTQSDRFSRMMDLVEIGSVFQRFLDQFPRNSHGLNNFTDYIFGEITSWISKPAAIFSASFTNRLIWQEISREFQLEEKLSLVEMANVARVANIFARQDSLAVAAGLWWESSDFAYRFEKITPAVSDMLGSISDDDFRRSILQDLREAERSLEIENYKAAVVMSGAAVEAMLLALLEQQPGANVNALRRLTLGEYLTRVRNGRLLTDASMIEVLDQALRDWRNLVHPGKALRTGIVLSEDHAQIAVSAARGLAKALN